jgi:hypothetical protein
MLPPYPANWEARLNEPRLGDDALATLLVDILEGRVRRAGSSLAEFGIGWVAFTEPSPLEVVFEAQLDLVPLRSLDVPVYRNEVSAFPAWSSDGAAWLPSGTGFAAPAGAAGAVTIAANADYRWGPGSWQQSAWFNVVSEGGGDVSFSGYGPRRMLAVASGAWAVLLLAAWAVSYPRRGR